MEKTLDELKQEATDLGIEFNANIGAAKLAQKIEEHYQANEAQSPVVTSTDDVVEEEVTPEPVVEASAKSAPVSTIKENSLNRAIRVANAKAMERKVVTITNNDKRDNHLTTTAYLSTGAVSKVVPLDIPVELEMCLIKIAQDIEIMLHVDEVIEGRRTGNKTVRLVKKYAVSFAQ